ncbi:MAG: Na+/H+ antiporter NhaC family protein [Planctomycetota bacterium]|nr:Na+/H+ antiporter NhaC family protein [Planctomycetota bacterium]
MMTSEHPFGWLSLVPPLTAIVLAILTKRVVFSLGLGIFVGALVLKNWNVAEATGHMCSDHLWNQLINSDTLHVFFFTILMGTMVGMINRAAGMRGLVNALTPFASNRKRGQLTTWFLGLFVFFDDYANTMLLGNTLKPLTDRLRIAREKLAYLVDSTAAPVAGLALISTWVAGEIGYVQSGLDSLPSGESWSAFSIFIQSIPYRFYVLFALLFVPMVALMGRDFGPMLKAERKAVQEGIHTDPSAELAGNKTSGLHRDPTSPEPDTPARWFNAVVPIVVTVAAVIYFLYTSGAANTESKSLVDIFGESASYSSLLWGALWGAATAYIMIIVQRIISFSELHQAAADGARLMVPALLILWLAQSMSGMTRGQDLDESHQPIASALLAAGANQDEIMAYVARNLDSGNQEPAQLLDTAKRLIQQRYALYQLRLDEELKSLQQNLKLTDVDSLKQRMTIVENKAFQNLEADLSSLMNSVKNHQSFKDYLLSLQRANEELVPENAWKFSQQFSEETQGELPRWTTVISEGDQATNLLDHDQPVLEYPVLSYQFLFREGKLYTGDFLSKQLASLREGDGFIANHFVPLLPTIVFVLASIVAFSTGTSWGTMGIVMPLVIPLAYSQLADGIGDVPASHPVFLGCVGSVLAGAIFGDHCSPISDTTVLSSQASGCDHVAHVRTQLPYALLVGFISILLGTLPIGYGINVWLLIPLGLAALTGSLWLFGSKVEPQRENFSADKRDH